MIGPWTGAPSRRRRWSARVRSSAVAAAEAALARIADGDGRLNSFTTVTAERALAEAAAVDAARAGGADLPPLAGAPYAVKNLFDLSGVVTVAGSKIERERPAADADAYTRVDARRPARCCVGALNMDEYAYGFTDRERA